MRNSLLLGIVAVALFSAVALGLSVFSVPRFGVAQVSINGTGYNAYVANTPQEQAFGLMDRANIGDCSGYGDCIGMLFIFPNDSQRCFWMKDTQIPLEQYWIVNGTITNGTYGVPYSLHETCHQGSIVLETSANSSIVVGQEVFLLRYLT